MRQNVSTCRSHHRLSTGIGYALAILLAKDPNKSFMVYATMRNLEMRVQLEETTGEFLETTLFIEELVFAQTLQ